MSNHFDVEMEEHMVAWRTSEGFEARCGTVNGKERPWALPNGEGDQNAWTLGLYPSIRESFCRYLVDSRIKRHPQSHNLKSSWILCANLYFPFRGCQGRLLLGAFLREHVSQAVLSVDEVDLEFESREHDLRPPEALGEPQGNRGSNQTSPDLAFMVRTSQGAGIVLTEVKFTEHSFYACSGGQSRYGNPDPRRCRDFDRVRANPEGECWQCAWDHGLSRGRTNRKYWKLSHFKPDAGKALTRCPAATAGYQLFRQQALAEAFAASGHYHLVASVVAYDARNSVLLRCLRATGIPDFRTGWAPLLDGESTFATFSHQAWVAWIRKHDNGTWSEWLDYVEGRYGFGPTE